MNQSSSSLGAPQHNAYRSQHQPFMVIAQPCHSKQGSMKPNKGIPLTSSTLTVHPYSKVL
jgi:hypothetical protein